MPSMRRPSAPTGSRRAPRRALTAVCAGLAALLAAGCTAQTGGAGSANPTSPTTAAGAARLHWHSCLIQGASLQCASLQVPLDYARPSGRKITLALSMVPATAPPSQRQGDLLVNPGGPGGSGLSLAA